MIEELEPNSARIEIERERISAARCVNIDKGETFHVRERPLNRASEETS
ncbi:hypothetical protein [Nocardia sp. CA-119907]